ncbi:MAG: hypothetical protein V7K50_19830 [Nostoc sp.]|uniref:hypothetical protein n=1 Tax=Nostoc sp. TaxID=1180 RepID=UPI002FF681AA
MVILNYETFRSQVSQELNRIVIPQGQVRKLGALEYADSFTDYIQSNLNSVDDLLRDGGLTFKEASESVTNRVLQITSFLYSVGAEHTVWRHWSSLTAFGLFLNGDIHNAAQYAVLGSEWDFVKILPNQPVMSQQVSEQIIWYLIAGYPAPEVSANIDDEEEDSWLKLSQSIPTRNHRETEEALKVIADYWIGESEGDWINFHPNYYPEFEPSVCAAAALARHYGFEPTSLTPEQYSFLEAGLAIPEPSPMFSKIFTVPESSTASVI